MKISPLLLLGSLTANVALLAVWLRPAPSTLKPEPGSATMAADRSAPPNKNHQDLEAALVSGDSAALAAAGVPADVVRTLTVGRAFDRMLLRVQELQPRKGSEVKHWRNTPENETGLMSGDRERELKKIQREFTDAIQAIFGADIESVFEGRESRYAFLPAAKREQLLKIERDYGEMQSQAYADQGGIELPSDREKIRLLRLEKERDILATLTPLEREQFELRTSPTANSVRGRYGDAIRNEEEYRQVFALQKAFDDLYSNPDRATAGPPTSDALRARQEAERKLHGDIRAVLDPSQLAAFQQASDYDTKTVTSLARRLNLPADTGDLVRASRSSYAAQSMRINVNPDLSATERRTQLQALATTAQTELQGVFGTEGAQAYAQRSPWITTLKDGRAFSTDPKDAPPGNFGPGTAVFAVPPPHPPTPPPGTPPPKN